MKPYILGIIISGLFMPATSKAGSWFNSISNELRYFLDEAAYTEQKGTGLALAYQLEFDHNFDSGNTFHFESRLRIDQHDDERNHVDIAELYWIIPSENWEVLIGLNKVFWGVTESVHLVDIINQTNQVEGTSGEDKLGQPMLRLNTFHDWGNLDFYLLTGFRERTFAGTEGRFRAPLVVDTDASLYESSDKAQHIDYAIRWSHTLDIWDIGLSYFDGTSRSPTFQQQAGKLVPFYPLITQVGLDLQATTESWLWKLEAINKTGKQINNATQAALGFEYTFVGVNDSDIDVGLIVEYLYDDRGEQQFDNPFENDILLATRIAFNDVQSTDILAGIISDLDNNSYSISLEANRRFGGRFTLALASRLYDQIATNDTLNFLRQDSYIEADLTYYFN